MPELPEVQSFLDVFNTTSTHKKIIKVTETDGNSLLKKTSFTHFKNVLLDKKFNTAHRRGKYLIVPVDHSDYFVVFHFGMTGDFHATKADKLTKEDQKYGKFIFYFDDGSVLVWINKRKFGKVYLVKKADEIASIAHLGPDALSLTKKEFLLLLKKRSSRAIKTFLMDQKILAGIGNEYSNEILYQSKIKPDRKISSLSSSEKEKLFKKMHSVLKKAITLQKSGKEYPASWLLSHIKGKNKDMQCPDGSGKVKKKTIGGRSAYYCPSYQK